MSYRFVRSSYGEMSKAAHAARFLLVEKIERIEIFYLTCKPDGKTLGIEPADIIGAAFAVHHGAPRRRHVVSARRNQPESGNCNSTSHKAADSGLLKMDNCENCPLSTINFPLLLMLLHVS